MFVFALMAHVMMKYFKKNGRDFIALKFRYDESLITICRALFARWSPAEMWWHMPYSSERYKRVCETIQRNHTLDTSPFRRAWDREQLSRRTGANDKKRVRSTLTEFAKKELKDYADYLEGRRYSESTLVTYTHLLSSFFGTIKFDSDLLLTTLILDQYNTHGIVRSGYSVSYQRQFVGALKHYLVMRPQHEAQPEQLERPPKLRRLPTVLSDREVLSLIGSIKPIKHRCVVAVLYATGMRISEVLNLELRHIDFDHETIHVVQSKGSKDRMIGLSRALKVIIDNYLMEHSPQRYLFTGGGGGPYSASSVRQIIKRAAKKAGIQKRVTPHVLRHSYATHLIDNGVNLRHVQELLGHAKPETTMIYTHVSTQKLTNIESPFDQLLKKNRIIDDTHNRIDFPGLSPS
jgi:integrase/recombinase XerD